jgi:alpha-amylase/alpha-mannosidase (GH57 family)
VHGHFYQPPREDPISGVIPDEAGSLPFRNWNEKIDAECYSPNAEAGNFERISFNIGPTLFNWL